MGRYTKIVLTVIAAALVTLVLQQAFSIAQAEGGELWADRSRALRGLPSLSEKLTDWPECVDEYGKSHAVKVVA